jgi:hypothetical protein
MKQTWETETSIENMEPVHPIAISFEESSEEGNDSDDWPFPVE